MSTIPKAVLEKIEEKYKHGEFYDGTQSPDYDIMVNQLRNAAEFGYQLATDGREELEKENEGMKWAREDEGFFKIKYPDEFEKENMEQAELYNNRYKEFAGQVAALQSSLKENEKECEELKDEVEWLTRKKQTIFELGMSWRKWAKEKLESQSKQIEELKVENERLQVAFDNNYKEFMLLGTHAKDLEAENKKLRDWVNATNPWKEDDK